MKNKIEWKVTRFEQFTINELYEILYLRNKVFVVEQNSPYLDLDYKDQKALHVHGYLDGKLVAYCRIFRKGDYFEEASIGRVIIAEEYRRYHLGDELMKKAIELAESVLNETKVLISAQAHLQGFYGKHGFRTVSSSYLEDGIPHVRMRKD